MSIYDKAAKTGTFAHTYMGMMNPLESPKSYDFFCAMWLISNAVGRRMVVRRPLAPVYLNTYIILCADAGITRKSTSVRKADEIFTLAGFNDAVAKVTASANEASMDNELWELNKQGHDAHLCVVVSELVTLMGKAVHAISTPGYLTDIYDCPRERTITRVASSKHITNYYPTVLSASTPTWLVRAINPDVIEGGFTSRCLFIWDEKPKRRVAWPTEQADSGVIRGRAVEQLLHIRTLAERWSSRGITLTTPALERFTQWYDTRELGGDDSFIKSFEAREDHHILRLAGLLACNDLSFIIDHHHIEHAIAIITSEKQKASAIFGTETKSHKRIAAGIDKLRQALIEAGHLGLRRTALLYKTRDYLTAQERDYVLQNMHELEMIQVFVEHTKGRKGTLYRGTNRLLNHSLNESLLERLTE